MKRLFLQLILTLIVGICSAQSEHMKFKGVPMEGTLQSFTNKLAAKGYTPIGTQDGVSILKGEFAGYKDCTIGTVSDKSGMVCKVAVMFPAMENGETWNIVTNTTSLCSPKNTAIQKTAWRNSIADTQMTITQNYMKSKWTDVNITVHLMVTMDKYNLK